MCDPLTEDGLRTMLAFQQKKRTSEEIAATKKKELENTTAFRLDKLAEKLATTQEKTNG